MVKKIKSKTTKSAKARTTKLAILKDGKFVCPDCNIEPSKTIKYNSEKGMVIFYKLCSGCDGIIKIEKLNKEI